MNRPPERISNPKDWQEFLASPEELESDWLRDNSLTRDEIAAFERRQLEREGAL